MIGETRFDLDRQMRFAALSGDYNPIHVDPIAVRRTLPARLVVHGVHVLVWALDRAGRALGETPSIARIRARYLRFTHIGDQVILAMIRSEDEIRLRVIGDGVVRAEFRVTLGSATASATISEGGETYLAGIGPLDHRLASIDGRRGQISSAAPTGHLAADYPTAARWIGATRINALAAASRLVGMLYPGLYSLLGGIDVHMMSDAGTDTLAFEMGELRHGQIDAAICGGGIVGTLDCRVPNPPATQPSCENLRSLVSPGRYSGARVLVIGGSRGAGETTAKLLALGGAEVWISYRDGRAEAADISADIKSAGGSCEILHYDTDIAAEGQLGELAPTHACWFATPTMVRPNAKLLDEERLADCQKTLVSSFFECAAALHSRQPAVRLLYPSCQWIDAPPPGLVEYLMAKAAAEILIQSMPAHFPGMTVYAPRLPTMATDQTARMMSETAPTAETMLPQLDRLIGVPGCD